MATRKLSETALSEIPTLFLNGHTLQQIADIYDVSRERIRQVLKDGGVTRTQGGASKRSSAKKQNWMALKNTHCMAKWGHDHASHQELIRLGKKMMAEGSTRERTPVGAFNTQRQNAKQRGIAWRLTLAEWWAVWQDSGHWNERGRGDGYCMARHLDQGAYEVGNVSIILATDNNREYWTNKNVA